MQYQLGWGLTKKCEDFKLFCQLFVLALLCDEKKDNYCLSANEKRVRDCVNNRIRGHVMWYLCKSVSGREREGGRDRQSERRVDMLHL